MLWLKTVSLPESPVIKWTHSQPEVKYLRGPYTVAMESNPIKKQNQGQNIRYKVDLFYNYS